MATKYSSLASRKVEEREIRSMKAAKANPVAWEKISEKQKFIKEIERREKRLAAITPPDLKGDEIIKAKRRHDMLKNAMIEGSSTYRVPAWNTQRMQEQAPAGAVDTHLQHDQFWKRHNLDANGRPVPIDSRAGQQSLQCELKDLMRTLGKEQEEWSPNVANLELYRRQNDNVPLADTSLPRSYGLTPAARENYDTAFPDHKPTIVEKKLRTAKTPCVATKKSGEPCKSGARAGSPFCAFHRNLEPVLDAPISTSAPIGG